MEPRPDTQSHEEVVQPSVPGLLAVLVAILLLGAIALIVWLLTGTRDGLTIALGVLGIVACSVLFIACLAGLTIVYPNHSVVMILLGRYRGTVRSNGFFWVNPFMLRKGLSLRVRNFESGKLKVNDKRGNPVEIAAVVVWRVRDTAQAMFDVEDYEHYVQVQSESAVRHLASGHPYDADDAVEGETSLRGSADVVNDELLAELGERLALAGIEVLETRLSHLAYAPEIAGAMLQRQQAEAIIAARTKIVDGAVSMVRMAIDELQRDRVVELDEERKAQMISNLLVVLCSERGTQPVVNTGTLYG